MRIRKSAAVVARSWGRRFVPFHRKALATAYGALHNHLDKPGLTGIDRSGTVENEGLNIAWYEFGPEVAAKTVVFIHGFALSSESYYDQVDYLREHYPDVKCLLVDVRGHGESSHAAADDCTIDGAADDVLTVIADRVRSGEIVLVGHSLGGMIALNFIRRCPESVYHRISGTLLIATSIKALSDRGLAQILESAFADFVYSVCVRLPEEVNRWRYEMAQFVAPFFAALVAGFPQMERIQFHVSMLLDTPLSTFVGFFDDLVDHEELAATPRLSKLDGVVMVGNMDIITPQSQSEFICEKWGNCTYEVVDGSGHMVILEVPEAVSKALSSLL